MWKSICKNWQRSLQCTCQVTHLYNPIVFLIAAIILSILCQMNEQTVQTLQQTVPSTSYPGPDASSCPSDGTPSRTAASGRYRLGASGILVAPPTTTALTRRRPRTSGTIDGRRRIRRWPSCRNSRRRFGRRTVSAQAGPSRCRCTGTRRRWNVPWAAQRRRTGGIDGTVAVAVDVVTVFTPSSGIAPADASGGGGCRRRPRRSRSVRVQSADDEVSIGARSTQSDRRRGTQHHDNDDSLQLVTRHRRVQQSTGNLKPSKWSAVLVTDLSVDVWTLKKKKPRHSRAGVRLEPPTDVAISLSSQQRPQQTCATSLVAAESQTRSRQSPKQKRNEDRQQTGHVISITSRRRFAASAVPPCGVRDSCCWPVVWL